MASTVESVDGIGPPRSQSRSRRHAIVAFHFLTAALLVGLWARPPEALPLTMTVASVLSLLVLLLRPPRWHMAAAGLLTATAVLVRINLSALPLSGRAFGFAAVAVCAAPFLIRPLRTIAAFPAFHLYCLFQALSLYIGVAVGRPEAASRAIYSDEIRTSGFALSLLFVTVLVASGLLYARRWPTSSPSMSCVRAGPSIRPVLAIAGGAAVGGLVGISGIAPRLGALAELPRLVATVGVVFLCDLWLRGLLKPRLKVLVLGFAAAYIFATIGGGGLYQPFGPFLALVALALARNRRVPAAWLALAVVVVTALNVGKLEYRRERVGGRESGIAADARLFLSVTARELADADAETVAAAAARFSNSDVLGYVRNVVPYRYPYWDKRSYLYVPLVAIPRVIVPFKPESRLPNEFGREYGLLDPSDEVTTANTSLSVQAYVNFGMLGLVGVAALAGLFLGWLSKFLQSSAAPDVVVGCIVSAQALGAVESGIAAFTLLIPFALILRPVARWVATGVRDRSPGRVPSA